MKMDFSHDRMVIDHSIVVSIAKLSMLNFAIDTPISWSIPTISYSFVQYRACRPSPSSHPLLIGKADIDVLRISLNNL